MVVALDLKLYFVLIDFAFSQSLYLFYKEASQVQKLSHLDAHFALKRSFLISGTYPSTILYQSNQWAKESELQVTIAWI